MPNFASLPPDPKIRFLDTGFVEVRCQECDMAITESYRAEAAQLYRLHKNLGHHADFFPIITIPRHYHRPT